MDFEISWGNIWEGLFLPLLTASGGDRLGPTPPTFGGSDAYSKVL